LRILPPPITATATASVRTKVHRVLRSIIDLGIADGTLRPDVTPRDIVTFGAMLAQTATHRSRLGRHLSTSAGHLHTRHHRPTATVRVP